MPLPEPEPDYAPALFEQFQSNASLRADLVQLVADLTHATRDTALQALGSLTRVEEAIRNTSTEAFMDFTALTLDLVGPQDIAKNLQEALHLEQK